MARIARIVVTGYPYHITQRGNYQQRTFINNADYSRYLCWLNKYSYKYDLCILAYCLMPNHVHFIAIPEKENSFAKTFNVCHMRYSQYLNRKNGVKGHLWQGRFYSCALDEKHLYAVVRYVENNPVRAGLVKNPADWKWSSARTHLYKVKNILPLANINTFINVDNWRGYLSQGDDKPIISEIKANTLTGRPSGNILFVQKFEALLKQQLIPRFVGRPRKNSRCP